MGKHYNSSEKKINIKKILFCIIIITAIAAFIVLKCKANNNKKEVLNIIDSALLSLKENNNEEVNKYIDYDLLITGLDDILLDEEKTSIKKDLFNTISWSVEDIEINKDSAVAIIEVSNKDYREILTKWMKEVVNEKNKGAEISDELALEKLQTIIKSETTMKTVIKKINFENQDGKWNVILDNNFIELVYPGIDSVTKALIL